MPLPNLADIESRRKKLGWKIPKLASQAGISRSALWKIESACRHSEPNQQPETDYEDTKRYIPNYEDAKKIFDELEAAEAGLRGGVMTKKVGTFAHYPLAFVAPNQTVGFAKTKMKKNKYSQIPVLKNNICVGRITDEILLEAVVKIGSWKRLSVSLVASIMGPPLPIVDEQTLLGSVLSLVRSEKAVLIFKEGRISGIADSFDIM